MARQRFTTTGTSTAESILLAAEELILSLENLLAVAASFSAHVVLPTVGSLLGHVVVYAIAVAYALRLPSLTVDLLELCGVVQKVSRKTMW